MSGGAGRRRKERLSAQEVARYTAHFGPARGLIACAYRPTEGSLDGVPYKFSAYDPWLTTLVRGLGCRYSVYEDFHPFLDRIRGSDLARWILNQAELPIALVDEFDAVHALIGAAGVYARIDELTAPRWNTSG